MTPATFSFPTIGVEAENRATLLAIDDHLLPLKKHLCYYLSKPEIRPQPVLTPSRDVNDAPDHYAAHFYGAVLQDEGRFRMWYYAIGRRKDTSSVSDSPLSLGPVCYAESDDGLTWTKPDISQSESAASPGFNAIALPDERIEGVSVIKDSDDPNPQRRYKMIYNPHCGKFWTIRTATSPDGLHWTAGSERPVDSFFEHASLCKHNGYYIVNGQLVYPYSYSEGGHNRGRQGFAVVSTDFDHWLPEMAESFTLPEPLDPEERGNSKPYDQVHLGVGAASFGTVLVGLYGLWHNHDAPDSWFGHEIISNDLGLVVSNDGLHFREPIKGQVYIAANESMVTPAATKIYPTILCQASGILNVGDETRIYHGRWRNARDGEDYYGEVALATLPRDRWGALGLFPTASQGSVWTAPFVVPDGGCAVALNADGISGIRLDVADEQFNLLPEYTGTAFREHGALGGLDCRITWDGRSLAEIGGRRVRLRVSLAKSDGIMPRLYALYLVGSD